MYMLCMNGSTGMVCVCARARGVSFPFIDKLLHEGIRLGVWATRS